jgi:hypothetical protein
MLLSDETLDIKVRKKERSSRTLSVFSYLVTPESSFMSAFWYTKNVKSSG